MPIRLVIKICGITNVNDAHAALNAGADWIGLNLVAGPRRIDLVKTKEIIATLPDPSVAVALICVDDASCKDSIDQLERAGVRRLQLYGNVTPTHLAALKREGFQTMLVRPIGDEAQLTETSAFLGNCRTPPDFILVDAHVPGQQGGTGERADWKSLQEARQDGGLADWPPIILAGGLTPDNVASGIEHVWPAGVDVSSGVELRPGEKDRAKMQAFVRAARAASSNS